MQGCVINSMNKWNHVKRSRVEEAIGELFDAYVSYQRHEFETYVDDSFVPSKYTFLREVEDAFYNQILDSVDVDIATVNKTNQSIAATVNWRQKIELRDSGEQIKRSGQTVFVFHDRDGRYLLYQLKGDNPF